MALEKLKILIETGPGRFSDEVTVLFNPNQLAFSKTVRWQGIPTAERDAPAAQFTSSDAASLTVELFIDTFEGRSDVRDHIRPIRRLTTVDGEFHRPPLARLQWGSFDFEGFDWALQSLSETLSLFLEDGTPVRAKLGCSFKQWRSDEEEEKTVKKASPDVAKTRVVRRGETLSSIAAEEYNDPSLWRAIAAANTIDNPRRILPGQQLAIPALTAGGGRSA